jgi:hypothetical protein
LICKYSYPGLLLLLLSAVVSCHDAPRNNPFDPELTPGVELIIAAVDTTAGTVQLQWSAYDGRQAFAEYRVKRRVQGLIKDSTLATITEVEQRNFIDTGIDPDLTYVYWVEVVNQGGFVVSSLEVPVQSFSVLGVDLLAVQADKLQGTIALRWQRYTGPNFERYEVWRTSFGQPDTMLQSVGGESDTVWTDTSPLPETEYSYWLELFAAGKELKTPRDEVSYELPPIELQVVKFSSQTAAAELVWSPYQGPRFAAYEVRRQSGGQAVQSIVEIEDVQATTHTDSLLDGNTEYIYHIAVRTTWEDIEILSNENSGSFYGLEETLFLPAVSNKKINAAGLALDEMDDLYTAATLISTTTAPVMDNGIRILFPTHPSYTQFFNQIKPHRLSPIHIASGQGRVYVVVRTEEDSLFLGAVGTERREIWAHSVHADGEPPVGLHVEDNNEVLLVDAQGIIYPFSADGTAGDPSIELQKVLITQEALPLQHMVVGKGLGLAGGDNDMFFMLAPQRFNNHVLGRNWTPIGKRKIFGGGFEFADLLVSVGNGGFVLDKNNGTGVGLGNGQTLTPLILAVDFLNTRLMVLERTGRLQVFDVSNEEPPRRYITKWGNFGTDEGEFQISPPTAVAMVVDSQGKIYVADGEQRIQIFYP